VADWTKKSPENFAAEIVDYCLGEDHGEEETLDCVVNDFTAYVAAARKDERAKVLAEFEAELARHCASFAYTARFAALINRLRAEVPSANPPGCTFQGECPHIGDVEPNCGCAEVPSGK
jgi:hypothetical protein